MCGISIAINTKNTAVQDNLIRTMNNKVMHRGPDDEGYYGGANFALGHRRLSILDLSIAGHQPMNWKDFWIVYNGEVYNYVELKEELKGLGYAFKTGTDTEVMLAAYEQWGVSAFSKFNGMWAFALYDQRSNEIIFCRDHFGIKPLYFTRTPSYFLAGSEIKQFTAVPDFLPKLDKTIAINFLVSGALNYSDRTFFEGVNELRPGHYLRYNLHTHEFQVKQWYDLDKASVPVNDNFDTAKQKVRSLFMESVRIRMRSDVRVGSCLSGGIDSSSIVSVIHSGQMANGDFATITSCYADKKYDEQQFSDVITQKTGFTSSKVYPELNHLMDAGDLDTIIYHQDQPFSGASHYSEFKVFQKARENKIIVMQDGQGSDEYLCGYGEFFITRLHELTRSFQLGRAYQLLKQRAAHKKTSWPTELKEYLRTAYLFKLQKKIKKLVGRSEYPWLSDSWKQLAAGSVVSFDAGNIRDLSITEIVHSSIPYQLHSEDRNSMIFSIESRLPFLDHRLVEYIIGLPTEYKINEGYSKYILRNAVVELPEQIKWRKDKMGFVAPDAPWVIQNKERIRKDLEECVQATGIFSMDLIKRFDRFIAGELGYEPIYFRAMALNRFCKIFKMEIR